jgi:hypothetical protein
MEPHRVLRIGERSSFQLFVSEMKPDDALRGAQPVRLELAGPVRCARETALRHRRDYSRNLRGLHALIDEGGPHLARTPFAFAFNAT